MRITVTSGHKQVDIRVKGHDADLLDRVEAAAHRLLTAAQGKPDDKPFGYTAASDTERAPDE